MSSAETHERGTVPALDPLTTHRSFFNDFSISTARARQRLLCGIVLWLGVVSAPPANAQSPADADALREELTELSRSLTAVEASTEHTAKLAAEIESLRERLQALETRDRDLVRAREILDQWPARFRAIEEAASALRERVTAMEQTGIAPPSRSAGGSLAWDRRGRRYTLVPSGIVQPTWRVGRQAEWKENAFSLRRVRLAVSGELGDARMSYRLQTSLIDTKDPLRDAYLKYRPLPWLEFAIGQFKTPFSRTFLTSSSRLDHAERPPTLTPFLYGWDVGVAVRVRGLDGRLAAEGAILNGSGGTRDNDNLDFHTVARVELAVVGKRPERSYGDPHRVAQRTVVLGAGVSHDLRALPATLGDLTLQTDVDGDGKIDNLRLWSWSFDLLARWRGFEFGWETVGRSERWGAILAGNPALAARIGTRATRSLWAHSGHLSYAPRPAWMVGVRAGSGDVPFLRVGNRASAFPQEDSLRTYEWLVQRYEREGTRLVGFNLQLRDWPGDSAREWTAISQLQLLF